VNHPLVTSGGRNASTDWQPRLDAITKPDNDETRARRTASKVTCPSCGGQATADRGRVFIQHRPRCQRRRANAL
jgi:hypothetical protein